MYLAINNSEDCQRLQHDLTLLQKWGDEWLMQFNASKCEVLRVSRARTKTPYTYILNGTPLKEADHTKYLGIHISKDLKWNKHIDVTTAKANRSLGFLKCNLKISSSVLRGRRTWGLYALRSSTTQQYGTQDQGLKIMEPKRLKWLKGARQGGL